MSSVTSCNCEFNQEKLQILESKINQFKKVDGGLIPILHEVQELYGYLPEEILNRVSEQLKIPMIEIYGVATFYSLFSLKPKGKYVIKVCLGTACYVKGSQKLLDRISKDLDITVGKTTADGLFTLEETRCLGACGLAPILMISDKTYGGLTSNDIPKILKKHRKQEGVRWKL